MRSSRRLAIFFFVLITVLAFAQDNPVADPKAVVISGNARFTVLTPQLIRMEWAEDGKFEDHASLVFINRRMPVPQFKKSTTDGWLNIETGPLHLRYREGSGTFTADNLETSLSLNGQRVVWHPGMPETGNLGGTLRTLDGVKGSAPLGQGLVSRDGWVVIDDTERPLFDNSDWPWVLPRPTTSKHQDWYFFGYGHDYKKALGDYTKVAGKIPLPPRFAFGTWWSRYWAYTDEEFKDLVTSFRLHSVPLDVLVIDMDWHPTFGVKWWENKKDASGHTLGWTGYTWNPLYFPDPPKFLSWVHQQGLKTTLNMHPASGVQPFEKQYPEMARAMGIDPATRQYVKFDIADKKFATNYMNILHHPFEKEGVDFFWLDWQQEPDTSVAGLNNTWWLNYVHFTDQEREGRRPLLFHRWGGLGNHRYQIGFSGDTISVWESLAFQPYFTATAANVGYGFWSHDIGGHMPGEVSPELFTRWIQFGVFSPILRTHTTKNPESERRIWAYPEPYADIMRSAYATRYALLPYIYTAAREAYDTGISMLRPMYYDYPESAEAYDFKDEYMFGDSLLVAPITAPLSTDSDLATKSIWLPPGEWIEVYTGARWKGPTKVESSFPLDEIPLYAKAGAMIPEQPAMLHTGEKPVDPLIIAVFPGANGSARIYDDASDTLGYKNHEYTWTDVRQVRSGNTVTIDIMPITGSYPNMPTRRAYEIHLAEAWPPQSVTVNGKPAKWTYTGNFTTVDISTDRFPVTQKVEIVVTTSPELVGQETLLSGVRGRIARYQHAMSLVEQTWPNGWAPDVLLTAVQTGNRISLHPETALQEVLKLRASTPEVTQHLEGLLTDLGTQPAKTGDISVGTTAQRQRDAVKRAIAHIAP
jgi:Glycosyl hydrolases family 31/Domain of unknown function (DUF5110)